LGAKIGVTLVLAFVAWSLVAIGFIRALKCRRHIVEGVGYILIGCAGWLATSLLWISGG
jgi:Na+/melibiose symporter-like transporter